MWESKGHRVGPRTVAALLIRLGYRLQAPKKTVGGLRVRAKLDRRTYPTGLAISKAERTTLRLVADDFHGEWNYALHPRDHD